MSDTARFLAADLQKADPDRYLLSLFAPADKRTVLQALFLLNHEIAKTRSVVSDTRLGQIRLQWWRDRISEIYTGKDGGQIPVLSTLAPAIWDKYLSQELFGQLTYAREFDLEDVPPASMDGLKKYAAFTTAPLNALALKILGENADEDEIGGISTNFGVYESIRAVPYMLSQGRVMLPDDLMLAKNLSAQKILDFNHKTEILEIVASISNTISPYRNPKTRFLKLQERMAWIYLNRLKKNNFDVFSSKMHINAPFLELRLALVH